MAIHLGPPVARRLMRPTRGLGSAPLPRRRSPAGGLRPPIWPCSGWSLPRFTPPTGRRRPAGIVTVALVLASRRTGVTRHPALRSSDFPHAATGRPAPTRDHPTASLTRRVYAPPGPSPRAPPSLARAPHDRGRPAGVDPVDRLVGQARPPTEFWARGTCAARPAVEAGQRPARRRPQRDQLRVLDPPPAGELLDDELRVEQQLDLARAQLAGQVERPDDARVLGDVVGLDAEVVGDRGVGRRPGRRARPGAARSIQRRARATPVRDCRARRRRCG